jgi:hypothetical protein
MRSNFNPKGRFVLILYEYRLNSESSCEPANVGAVYFSQNTRASLVVSRTVVTHFPNSWTHTLSLLECARTESLFWMDVMRETKVEANSCPKSFSRRKIAFSSESLLKANEFKFASNLFCFGAGVWIFVKKNHLTTRITLVCVTLSLERGGKHSLTDSPKGRKTKTHTCCVGMSIFTMVKKIVIWLILPVVICLSQRLSHACLSINNFIL